MSARTNRNTDEYRITIRPLSKDEGGGYLVEYPKIPGCMSDGETIEEAIANGREALRDCIEVFQESGRKVPQPGLHHSTPFSSATRSKPSNKMLPHRVSLPLYVNASVPIRFNTIPPPHATLNKTGVGWIAARSLE